MSRTRDVWSVREPGVPVPDVDGEPSDEMVRRAREGQWQGRVTCKTV